MNILELTGINKIYGSDFQTQVLYDINLSFAEHSFNSIIGQSGSGKSTLLNIMGTLDKPTSGQVQIGDQSVAKMKEKQLASLRNDWMGFVFQFHYLLPEFTALENVLIPYEIKNGRVDNEALDKAKEYLRLVGLEQVMNNPATKMSGGQQQRTAIARAMINNPKIILADEPTGNLNSKQSEEIMELFAQLNKEGVTIIQATHSESNASFGSRIINLLDGKIV